MVHLSRTFGADQGLTAIAKAVGASTFHMCRVFRRETGMSIHAYRTELRLRHALEALDRPDVDLLSLALDVGYSGQATSRPPSASTLACHLRMFERASRDRKQSREDDRFTALHWLAARFP
jgi:methylphosphotriester-DNA--protein-cysteine methyltransferase